MVYRVIDSGHNSTEPLFHACLNQLINPGADYLFSIIQFIIQGLLAKKEIFALTNTALPQCLKKQSLSKRA